MNRDYAELHLLGAQLSLKVMGKSVLQDLGRGLVLSQDIRIKGKPVAQC